MSYVLLWIPAIIFGLLSGMNSAWWLLGFILWEFTLGFKYAEMLNGGRLGSAGIGVFVLDFVVLLVIFILSALLLPSFSFLSFIH